MKYSVCIEMMFLEVDFYDRFKLAKEAGFDYVEFWSWNDKDLDKIISLCQQYGIKIASFSGDQDYSLCDDSVSDEYVDWMVQSFKTANKLDCDTVIIHSNQLVESGLVANYYEDVSDERLVANMVKTLLKLKPLAEEYGVTMELEALNTKVDHVGNFLWHTDAASDIVRAVDCDKLGVIYDMYHMQIMHGDLLAVLEKNFDVISYIHIADNPGRCEPGTGEINYGYIIQKLKEMDYKGYVGFELSASVNSALAVEAIKKVW